ncbi:MAG TPA: ATP-binding protein [Puia sp.]|nr:ATP-binding protein [Puia sp.]
MEASGSEQRPAIRVRETEILPTDSRQQYREKIARITLDSMVQFVGLLDVHGTVLEINHVALNAVGVSLKEVENQPFWTTFWWQVSRETNDELRAMIARAASGEFVRWDTSIYGRAGGKETIIIDASLCPVWDDKGNVVFLCAEGRDISEKKAQEREIAQKNIELRGLLERIRELDEIKTQFFANVSHELRTPIALIIGPAERLMRNDASMTPALRYESANSIARNAKMLLKHVNDLLDISRLEAKKLKIERKDTDAGELVRFIASHFGVLAKERNIDYRIGTGDALHAAIDPGKLQRIVMNLLSNAFKFAPEGGTIRCTLTSDSADLILTIEDSGPGVRPELRRLIFERFRQGDGATNRQFSGTGLGLAIVHEFVQLHKGTIEVDGSDLGGALFRVKLPGCVTGHGASPHPPAAASPHPSPAAAAPPSHAVSSAAAASPRHVAYPATDGETDRTTLDGLLEELRIPSRTGAPAADPERKDGSREVILVVEDNPEMNRFICQALAGEFEVVAAFDGDEGLRKALVFLPTMILTDIMMPRVSGEEMIAGIRRQPELNDTLILLLSAKADDDLKLRLLKDGAQDFITKPFSEVELLVRVRNLVRMKRTSESARIAERRKREVLETDNRALQSRAQQLSDLFHQTPSFMALLRGGDFTFQFANDAYLDLIGRTGIAGKPLVKALPEIATQEFLEILNDVMTTGKAYSGKAARVLLQRDPTTEMEERFVDFIYEPYSEDGRVVGIFVEGHDVTDEVRIRTRLMENETRLEQQVLDRTRELVASNEDLQQFAHVASHDLKEPIRKILTFSNRLKSEMSDQISEQGKSHLDKILSASNRAYSMIEGVLAYSMANGGDQVTDTVDLNDVLKELQSDLEIPIAEKNATIETENLPVLTGAPVLLYQLFYNLINNSLKFSSPDRPASIRVAGSPVEINGQPFAKITITDNGIGFSMEYAEKIFGPFARLHSKDRYEGTGLGLALCKKIVQRHGGFITASAENGAGAAFTVLLPKT